MVSVCSDLDGMTVRITHEKRLPKFQCPLLIHDEARRNKLHVQSVEIEDGHIHILDPHDGFSVNKIIRVFVGGEGSTVTRTHVFQEFDTRPGRRAQRCDAEMSAEYVVEVLLFRSVIFAFSHHMQNEKSLVEP